MINDVAIYLRKSREDEELKEETLARHEKMLLEYCARNKLNIVKIYKEVVSGESIANRPEMQRLLDDVAAGAYNGVVCIEIERLSRGNQLDQCEILEVFKSSNTKIYTLNKIYDLTKEDMDEEFFEFALFMSRREYKTIRRRLQRGRMQATKDGYFTGGILPFGFDKKRVDGGFVLVPNTHEAQIVRLIFNMYLNGVGTWKIAGYLNEKGISTRHGRGWQDYTVKDMLSNRNYIGYVRSSKLNTWIEGKHEAIIPLPIFERAQELKAQTATKCKRKVEVRNPLATITRCGICGYVMHRKVNRGGIEYLTCPRNTCNNKSSQLEAVEAQLIEELKAALKDFNYFLLNSEDKLNDQRAKRDTELNILRTELVKKEAMLEKACEMLETGIYTIDLFKKRTSAVEADIKELKSRISDIESTPIEDDKKVKNAIPILEKVLEKYHGLNAKEKNLLLKSIVESVLYTRVEDDIKLDIALLV